MIGALVLKLGLGRAWRAFNRRDLDYFDRYIADDIVYEVAGPPPLGGRFVGKKAWREANQRWMDAIPFFKVRVVHEALTNPLALGLTNTVMTEYELIEKTPDGRVLRQRCIDISELRRGRTVRERQYWFDVDGEAAIRKLATPVTEPERAPARETELVGG